MKKTFAVFIMSFFVAQLSLAHADEDIKEVKRQIVNLAKSFEGQGDPDFTKQNALEPLVQKLLALAPSTPIEKRIDLVVGVWKQVWGPYEYKNNSRGVDPELGTEEIYQVVNSGGYYYNVSYLYKDGDKSKKRIGLLRGEFQINDNSSDFLNVKFTDYPGASSKSDSVHLWQLADLAENNNLPNRITIVPSFIVKLFFGGGTLREVYTDSDLRITYGSSKKSKNDESIYIMTRVK